MKKLSFGKLFESLESGKGVGLFLNFDSIDFPSHLDFSARVSIFGALLYKIEAKKEYLKVKKDIHKILWKLNH